MRDSGSKAPKLVCALESVAISSNPAGVDEEIDFASRMTRTASQLLSVSPICHRH